MTQRSARWLMPEDVPADVGDFARALGVGLPAARVLWHRGYRDEACARRFLTPSLEHLEDPFGLRDMDRAADRLARAVRDKERILLYGDYDVDGTVSIVILKKALELAGVDADFHVPHRLRDGYGMREDVIDAAAANGTRLIVSVDTGIRAGAVVERARMLGVDVIVTDHHLPEATLPPAWAVVNPNRPDCGYPEKNLCGAGVTLKLLQALLTRLEWPYERVQRMLLSFLKLVALATVADVVPLTGENRVIVKLGLDGYDTIRNPGLRALLGVAGIADGRTPSSGQVAFQLAPRINAAGRMADAADVVRMFLTSDGDLARTIAQQLHDLNRDRQQTEQEIVRTILDECERVPVSDGDAALVFSGDGWHKGVVGIVASRLVERFHRPAFVLSEDADTGTAQGSARSVPGFHLLAALERMPELFTRFGGHKQAAGLTLPVAAIPAFRDRMNVYAAALLSPDDFRPTVEMDAVLALSELNDRCANDVLALAPFGFGNSEPTFAVLDVEIAGPPRLLGTKGQLIPLRQNGRTVMVKSWNTERTADLSPGTRIDVAMSVQDDEYSRQRGYGGWCAVLRDARPASARRTASGPA